jgi:hypothetical protein
LGEALKFFGPLLDPSEGVEGGVLGDGLDVIEAGEGGAGGVNRDFGDEKGAVENVGVLADRGNGSKVD